MVVSLVGQAEAGALVDPPGVLENVVGPEGDALVARSAGEANALLDETGADAHAAGVGLDQKEAELGDLLLTLRAEHAPDQFAVELGHPSHVARGVAPLQVVGDDAGDERLEADIPAVLLGVQRAVALDDPAVVAGLRFS